MLKLNKDTKADINLEIEIVKSLFNKFYKTEKYEIFSDTGYTIVNNQKEDTMEFILFFKIFEPILAKMKNKTSDLKDFIEKQGYTVSYTSYDNNKIYINIIYNETDK